MWGNATAVLPPCSGVNREPSIRGHRQDRDGSEVPSKLVRLFVPTNR